MGSFIITVTSGVGTCKISKPPPSPFHPLSRPLLKLAPPTLSHSLLKCASPTLSDSLLKFAFSHILAHSESFPHFPVHSYAFDCNLWLSYITIDMVHCCTYRKQKHTILFCTDVQAQNDVISIQRHIRIVAYKNLQDDA